MPNSSITKDILSTMHNLLLSETLGKEKTFDDYSLTDSLCSLKQLIAYFLENDAKISDKDLFITLNKCLLLTFDQYDPKVGLFLSNKKNLIWLKTSIENIENKYNKLTTLIGCHPSLANTMQHPFFQANNNALKRNREDGENASHKDNKIPKSSQEDNTFPPFKVI
jgi:hypothetical protein